MNEATSENDDEAKPYPPARCDDYEEYLDETLGYAYDARDLVSIASLQRHDELRRNPEEALEELGLSLDELTDFERLGAARGWLAENAPEQFWEAIQPVLDDPDDAPGVAYADAHLWVIGVLADAGKYDAARRLLEDFVDEWPDDPRGPLLEARIVLEKDGPEAAEGSYDDLIEEFGQDVELMYEIAEDHARAGAPDAARQWIERTRERADEIGDRAVVVDLELLEDDLAEEPKTDDAS